MQTTCHVLMIRPARFVSNPQTAASNAFQQALLSGPDAQAAALAEFDAYAAALRAAGVSVLVINDLPEPHTPDSIFPNNWVSFHADGRVLLYPMEAPNRRLERRTEVLAEVARHFMIHTVTDLGDLAERSCFLEGTGSLVLDHEHKIAYVCHSSRSHPDAMREFVALTGYRPVWFHARDRYGKAIYHTNVMMCIGRTLAVVCMESLTDPAERGMLAQSLRETGKELIDISFAQMESFAGNMLELCAQDGQPVFAMSRSAWGVLTDAQRSRIENYARPVLAPIETIEKLGGGSARCMIAEIFLSEQTIQPTGWEHTRSEELHAGCAATIA